MTQNWNAEQYGKVGAFVHQLAGGVVDWLAPQTGERILDLGCANGGSLAASKNKGFKDLTGVDPSEAASLYCRPDIITLSQGSTSCYGIC